MIRDDINQLIEEITCSYPQEDIFEAKKDFQKISGEIFEDDKSFESRMGCFLEWYTFDRVVSDSNLTPLQDYLQGNDPSVSPEKWGLAEAISKSIHGIFTAQKIKNDYVMVLDIFDDQKYQVQETQGSILFNPGDIFEGRIIPYKEQFYFTDHFCYHPKPTAGFIKSKIKNLKTEEEKALILENQFLKALRAPQKNLNKVNAKIEKLNKKLEDASKEKNILSLHKDISKLKTQKEQLETQIMDLQKQLTDLRTQIIEGEHRQNRFTFIRQLSYMSLKWERSRQIDIHDIYRD